jgi:microcystin-dependent protein
MSEPFIGEIRLWALNYAPAGWAHCDGTLLQVSQNTALFSLIGTTYGGDGRTTFALPDLRGRVPIHQGQGVGLNARNIGQKGGTETVVLTTNQMPVHRHNLYGEDDVGTTAKPGFDVLPGEFEINGKAIDFYSNSAASRTLNANHALTNTGGNMGHENRMPYLTMNYCIALTGIYPTRN